MAVWRGDSPRPKSITPDSRVMVPGVDMSSFGKNQLGDDSTGLPGRVSFFGFVACPFSNIHVH